MANKWGQPLLKLSMNKIMNKLVGESEKKIDQAFRVATACAPCVMLWDEVEKILGGIKSSNASDSGTTARVFASCLNFLTEDNGVFVIMTSNDISQLPPEFTRAGRLDAIWYFSLPSIEERTEIYKIHLGRTKKALSDDLIEFCAKESQYFTGAEIEQSVIAGMRKAYKRFKIDGNNSLTKEDMADAIKEVIPLYESSREKIAYLESWAKGRARFTNETTHADDYNETKDNDLLNEMIEDL